MRLLVATAIALITLAAGSGGATPPAGATAATATTAAATQAASTAAPATAASGPSILDLLKAGKATTYKATYKWSITAGGQTQTSEQTWYYKAPNSRFDFSAGPGATFSVFSLPDGTYLCTNAGGQAFCQKSGDQAAFGQNPAADFALQLQGGPSQFHASLAGTQAIAGQQAQCHSVKSPAR